mmetsp:Transcript_47348/g.115561  ORF Transcript_47348/g.115561 Transcript_47348/m.115561 type:complete len:117 (-) Transcript_47348:554-904(-)
MFAERNASTTVEGTQTVHDVLYLTAEIHKRQDACNHAKPAFQRCQKKGPYIALVSHHITEQASKRSSKRQQRPKKNTQQEKKKETHLLRTNIINIGIIIAGTVLMLFNAPLNVNLQ